MTREILNLYGDGPDPVGHDELVALQDLGLSKREGRLLLRLLLGRTVHALGMSLIEDLAYVLDEPLGEVVVAEMEYVRPLSPAECREFEALARRLDDFAEAKTAAVWAYARGYEDRHLHLLFDWAPCGVCRERRRIRAPEVADQRGLPSSNVVPFRERPRGEG